MTLRNLPLLLLAGAVLGRAVPAAEPAPVPAPLRLRAAVGGFLGSAYLVELREGRLFYTERRRVRGAAPQEQPGPVVITPTAGQWREFRRALDEVDVWCWRPDYNNFDVMDGVQWSLDVAYPDRVLKTQGSNSYPEASGQPNAQPEQTGAFRRYLAAIKELTGGRGFE